jgi:hypothetical protein
MDINGYTIQVEGGNLKVFKEGKLFMATKGDPRKKGNPAFSSLEDAAEYFNTTSYAKPFVDADPDAPVDADVDPAV